MDIEIGNGRDSNGGREFSGRVATHTVRHHQQAGSGIAGVFVSGSYQADIGSGSKAQGHRGSRVGDDERRLAVIGHLDGDVDSDVVRTRNGDIGRGRSSDAVTVDVVRVLLGVRVVHGRLLLDHQRRAADPQRRPDGQNGGRGEARAIDPGAVR